MTVTVECGAHVGSTHSGHDCIAPAGHTGEPHQCFCTDVWRDGDTGSVAADNPVVNEWLESDAPLPATPATLLTTLVRFRIGGAENVTVRGLGSGEAPHALAKQGEGQVVVTVPREDTLLRELLGLDRRPTGLDAVLELRDGLGRAQFVRTLEPELEFLVRFAAVRPQQVNRDPEG